MSRWARVLFTAAVIMAMPALARAQQVKPSCTDNSRRCMIAAATSYLEGITHHDGSKVLFAADAVRTEQGRDTGKGADALRAALLKMPPMLGYSNTRFVIDEKAHQLVYFTLLHLNVDPASLKNPQVAGATQQGPVTVHLAERFKIEHGLITEIEAIFHNQTGTTDGQSGWPDE